MWVFKVGFLIFFLNNKQKKNIQTENKLLTSHIIFYCLA
jgi:hypothetical protein